MNKNILYKYAIYGTIVGITFSFLYIMKSAYLKQERVINSRINFLFKQSVQIEKKKYIIYFKSYFNSKFTSNKISGRDKQECCYQYHFIKKDPNRTHLDSIFNAELTKEGILGKGVIYCTYRNKETCSSPDTLFKKNAIPLEPIVFRINEKEENNIILQAYVQISFWGILFQTTEMYFLFFIWILLIIGIIYKNKKAKEKDLAIKIKFKRLDELRIQEEQKLQKETLRHNHLEKMYKEQEFKMKKELALLERQRKKEQKQYLLAQKEQEDQKKRKRIENKMGQNHKNKVVQISQTTKIKWTQLPNGLLFNREQAVFLYKKEIFKLSPSMADIFTCFLEAEQNLLTYSQIYSKPFKRKEKEILSASERATINTSITRLRKFLVPFPFIHISTHKGIGYQLVITEIEEDTPISE